MKKIFTIAILFVFMSLPIALAAFQASFPQALKTCETYSQKGGAEYEHEYFGILITLEKSKNKCVYKEKIFQDKKYQMLTCHFDMELLPKLSDSMQRFNNAFSKEIAKNNIFSAKMTTNGEIFQTYLINPKYCSVSHSKQ